MESFASAIELQKRRTRVDEKEEEISPNKAILGMLDVMLQDIKHLQKQQIYQLSEQEKIHYRTLEIDKVLSEMVDNQKEMKNNIDTLIERWG
jgi:DNA polymerase III psi subunit